MKALKVSPLLKQHQDSWPLWGTLISNSLHLLFIRKKFVWTNWIVCLTYFYLEHVSEQLTLHFYKLSWVFELGLPMYTCDHIITVLPVPVSFPIHNSPLSCISMWGRFFDCPQPLPCYHQPWKQAQLLVFRIPLFSGCHCHSPNPHDLWGAWCIFQLCIPSGTEVYLC